MSVYKKFFCSLILILGCMVGVYGCSNPLDNISVSVKCDSFVSSDDNMQTLVLVVDSEDPDSGKIDVEATITGLKNDMLSTIEWNYDKRFLYITKSDNGKKATIEGINPTITHTKVTAYSVENYKAKFEFWVSVVVKAKSAAPKVKEGEFGIPIDTDFTLEALDLLEFNPYNSSIPTYSYKIYEIDEEGQRAGLIKTLDENEVFSLERIPDSGFVEIECVPTAIYLDELEEDNLTVVIPNVVVYTPLLEENTFIKSGPEERVTSISLVRNDRDQYYKEIDIVNSLGLPLSVTWHGEDGVDDFVLVEAIDLDSFVIQAVDVIETIVYFDVRLANITNSVVYSVPLEIVVSTLPSYITINDGDDGKPHDEVYVANVSNVSSFELKFDIIPSNAVVEKVIKIQSLTNEEIRQYGDKISSYLVGYQPTTLLLKAEQHNTSGSQDVILNGFRKDINNVPVATEGDPTQFELTPNEDGKCVLQLQNIKGSCGKVVLKVTVNDITQVERLVVVNLLQYASIVTDVKMGEQSAMTLDVNGEDQLLNLVDTYKNEAECPCKSALVKFKMRVAGSNDYLAYDSGIAEGNIVSIEVGNEEIVRVTNIEKSGDYGQFRITALKNGNTYIKLIPSSGESTKIYVNVYSEASSVNVYLRPQSVTDNAVGFADGYVNIARSSNEDIKEKKVLLRSNANFNLDVSMDKAFNYDDDIIIKCEYGDDSYELDSNYYLSIVQNSAGQKGNFILKTLANSNKNDGKNLKITITVKTRKVSINDRGAYVLPSNDTEKTIVGREFVFWVDIFHPVNEIVFRQSDGSLVENLVYIDILTTVNDESSLEEDDLILENMKKGFYVGLQGSRANEMPTMKVINELRVQDSLEDSPYENNYCIVTQDDLIDDLEDMEFGNGVYADRERYVAYTIESIKVQDSEANFVSAEFFVEFRVIDYNRVEIVNEIRVVVTLLGASYKVELSDYTDDGRSVATLSSGVRLEPYREGGFSFNTSVSVPNKNYLEDLRLWIVTTEPIEGQSYINGMTTDYMYLDYSFEENQFVDVDEDAYENLILTIEATPGVSKGEVRFNVKGKLEKFGHVYVMFLQKSLIDEEAPTENVLKSLKAAFNLFSKAILFHVPEGSEVDPYFIEYENDLIALNNRGIDAKSKSYSLTRDIEITSREWTPITDFSGTLNSGAYLAGYNITGINWNVTVTRDSSQYYGLFSKLCSGAKISNINIEVDEYSVTIESVSNSYVSYGYGILAGEVCTNKNELGSLVDASINSGVTIENVLINCKRFSFTGNYSINKPFYLGAIGYISGQNEYKLIVSNYCVNMDMVLLNNFGISVAYGALAGFNEVKWETNETSTVSTFINAVLSGNAPNYIGGALGANESGADSYGELSNIETNGKIEVNSTATSTYVVGGIVGRNNAQLGSLDGKCLSFVEIITTGKCSVGGAVGYNGGVIENVGVEISSYLASSTAIKAQDGSIGGLVGEMTSGSIECCYVFDNNSEVYSIHVTGSQASVGGLIGKFTGVDGLSATISETYAICSIGLDNNSDSICVGGLCGYSQYASIENSYAKISIEGINQAIKGALVGNDAGDTVISCSYAVASDSEIDIVGDGNTTYQQAVLWYDNRSKLKIANDNTVVEQTSMPSYSAIYYGYDNNIWELTEGFDPILKNNKRMVLTEIRIDIKSNLLDGVKNIDGIIVIDSNFYPKPKDVIGSQVASNTIMLEDLINLTLVGEEDSPIVITSSDTSVLSVTNANKLDKIVINNLGVVILRITSKMDSNIFKTIQISITNAFSSIAVNVIPSVNSIVKQDAQEEGTEEDNTLFSLDSESQPDVKLLVGENGTIGITFYQASTALELQNVSGGVYILANGVSIGGEQTEINPSSFGISDVNGYTVYDLEDRDKCSIVGNEAGDYKIYIVPYIKYSYYLGDNIKVQRLVLLDNNVNEILVAIVAGAYDIDFDVNDTELQVSDNFVGKVTFMSSDTTSTNLLDYCNFKLDIISGEDDNDNDDDNDNEDVAKITFGSVSFDENSRASTDITIEFSEEFRKSLTRGALVKLVVESKETISKAELEFIVTPQKELHVDLKFYSDMLDNDLVMMDAGYLSSNTILPGHFGLLNIDVSPIFLDYDYITVTSPAVMNRVISMWQRVRKIDDGVMSYLVYNGVENLSDGLKLINKVSEQVGENEYNYDGNYYIRVLTAGGLNTGYSVDLMINIVKNEQVVLSQMLTLTVRDAGMLKLTYNPARYDEEKEYYYVAIGTGGANQALQNQNEIGVELDESIYTNHKIEAFVDGIRVPDLVKKDTNTNKYYLDLSSFSNNEGELVRLDDEIKVILTGWVTYDYQTREDNFTIKFKVVDIFIDDLAMGLTEENTDASELKLLYSNNKSYTFRMFNSSYNANGSVVNLSNLTTITFGAYAQGKLCESIAAMNGENPTCELSIEPSNYEQFFTFAGRRLVINDLSGSAYTMNAVVYYKYVNGEIYIKPAEVEATVGYRKLMLALPMSFYQLLSKDSPNPIYKWEELRGMQEGNNYIVMNDIEIPAENVDWLPIKIAISSLDGNNYAIILPNTVTSGLFDEVGTNTVLKNITIKFKEPLLQLSSDVRSFGALAISNRGVIYNCVVNGEIFSSEGNGVISSTTSITMYSPNANLSGLVVQNSGTITNSRVKNINMRIMGNGSIGGLVVDNRGYISASSYSGGELRTGSGSSGLSYIAAGLAVNNSGYIWGSFSGQMIGNTSNSQNDNYNTQIVATTSSGFVQSNSGSITNCYSAVSLIQSISGGSSGFVHNNQNSISKVYTISKIRSESGNIISGCEPLVISNSGSIEYAYYLDTGFIAAQEREGVCLSRQDFRNKDAFDTFIFSNNNEFDGTWVMAVSNNYFASNYGNNFGPMLVSASRIDVSQKELVNAIIDTTSSSSIYTYQFKGNDNDFRPVLVTNIKELNDVFAHPVNATIVGSRVKVHDDIRLAKNISFSDLSADVRYAGASAIYGCSENGMWRIFEGNGYTISNIELTDQYKTETLALIGYTDGAIIQNLDISVVKVWGTQTQVVGALVGICKDTLIHNINVASVNDQASVSALNIAGSVVGYAKGATTLEYITSSLAVSSSFVDDRILNQGKIYKLYGADFISEAVGEGFAVGIDRLGYTGGIVGIMDTSTTNSHLIYTMSSTILGKVVGGIAGLVGSKASLTDSTVWVDTNGNIIPIVLGGGLVGENHGVISYCVVDYLGGTTVVFVSDIPEAHDCLAVGGLVGLNIGLCEGYYENLKTTQGSIYLSGAYINVSNTKSKYVGGLVGITIGGNIYEVFATGNVSGSNTAYVGGLFGAIGDIGLISQVDEVVENCTFRLDENATESLAPTLVVNHTLAYNSATGGNIGGFAGRKTARSIDAFSSTNVYNSTYTKEFGDGTDSTNMFSNVQSIRNLSELASILSIWDTSAITTTNKYGKNVPVIQRGVVPDVFYLTIVDDVWQMYWHPDKEFKLTGDIDLTGSGIVIGDERREVEFSGKLVDDNPTTTPRSKIIFDTDYFIYKANGATIKNVYFVGVNEGALINENIATLTLLYTQETIITHGDICNINSGTMDWSNATGLYIRSRAIVSSKSFVNMITGGITSDSNQDPSVEGEDASEIVDNEDENDEGGANIYNSSNNTKLYGEVRATDLGYPLWDEQNSRLLLFFGDTVGNWSETTAPDPSKVGNKDWRNNVMMYSTDNDYSDGLDITGYMSNGALVAANSSNEVITHASALIKGKKVSGEERTKLPTGVVKVGDTIYMFYMSKKNWNQSIDSVNYGGFIKSTDGGATWTRVNQLSWANHSSGKGSAFGDGTKGLSADMIENFMNEDINLQLNIDNADSNWVDIASHEGYFFTTVCPVDGKDGYIYLFGTGSYRSHGFKLARVKKENFESFSAYEYLLGYENGQPIFKYGNEVYTYNGVTKTVLQHLNSKNEQLGFVLGNNSTKLYPCTVMYSTYLKKWVLSSTSSEKGGIFFALSDNIWGPYDYEQAQTVFTFADAYLLSANPDGTLNTQIYGGYINEHLTSPDGSTIYMIVSQSSPLYQSSLVRINLGEKYRYITKHIVPLSEMEHIDKPIDSERIITLNDVDYYCLHETYSATSYRIKDDYQTISLDSNFYLKGFLADELVRGESVNGFIENYIIYRRKAMVRLQTSILYLTENGVDTEIEELSIDEFWIGYMTEEGIDGIINSNGTPTIGENILYNGKTNRIYIGCPDEYRLYRLDVYKSSSLVEDVTIRQAANGRYYYTTQSSNYKYRFVCYFERIE